MKKEISPKSKISKIVISLLLIFVIFYSLKSISLNLFGKETTGYITSVNQRYDKKSKSNSKRYRNTINYYFELDGKKYERHVSYKTNMPLVKKDNQEKEKVTIQYLDLFPSISTIAEYNKPSVFNYTIWIGLIIISIVIILYMFGVKIKKTKGDEIEKGLV